MTEWSDELRSVNMAEHALRYAARGWHVLPVWWCSDAQVCACPRGGDCSHPGKHPLVQGGVNDASANRETVSAWWSRWPMANIGMAAGKISGVVVLDADGTPGLEALVEFIKVHGKPAATVGSVTGGGGRHLFWRYPEGVDVKNRVRVGVGLDVRSDGGYIILPPSLHACGARYEWHPAGHPGKVNVAKLPAWVGRLMLGRKEPTNGKRVNGGKVKYRLENIPPFGEGARNCTLYSIGCRLRRFGYGDAELADAMRKVNATKANPPLGDRELAIIVKSACKFRPGE